MFAKPIPRNFSFTCCRAPSPFGVIQVMAPLFKSYAVMRPYGGLNKGNPRGPTNGTSPLVNSYSKSDSRFFLPSVNGVGCVIEGT